MIVLPTCWIRTGVDSAGDKILEHAMEEAMHLLIGAAHLACPFQPFGDVRMVNTSEPKATLGRVDDWVEVALF
jgi:hypothetical protein